MQMNKLKEAAIVLLLVAISAAPRFVGLGQFTSIDEPFWLRASGNFYYALGQHQFENTLYEYHPAVTTMWAISAGMLAYFPDYRKLGQGYLRPGKFDLFMQEHGKSLLQLLIDSRAVQVIVIVILLLVIYFLLRRLFGTIQAFFATGLISVSPFFLGHSRLLNHEAMLALFLLVSVLALLVYIYSTHRLRILILSGAAAALAQLTKSSGIVLFPVIGLMLLVAAFGRSEKKLAAALLDAASTLGLWLLFMAAAYVLFWPGMWVAPGKMLYEVYGNALTYAFQGARLSETQHVAAASPPLANLLAGLQIYLNDLAWRVTPLSWLGFLFGIGFALRRNNEGAKPGIGLPILYAGILGLLFLILFSVQIGPKPPHYILTAYVAIDLIAGLGYASLVAFVSAQFPRLQTKWFGTGALAAILALQLAMAVGFYPYYITYYDPLLEAVQPGAQNPTLRNTGYGVGLDRAAAYLAQKPGAAGMTVMSANGLGSFSYYFPGRTIAMNALTLSDPLVLDGLKASQYVVVDYYNQRLNHRLADLLGLKPEKDIRLNNIDFLRIYRSADVLAKYEAAHR